MTDSEYLSQRKELENRIAQLDAAHLNDREYMDGDHVHIDIGWKSVRGVICGCYIEKADGSIHYILSPAEKGWYSGESCQIDICGLQTYEAMNIVYLCIITLFAGLTPSGQAKIDKLLSMASNYQQVEKTIMLLMQPNKVIHPDTLYLAVAGRGSSPYPGKFSIRPAASPDPERIQTSFRRRPSGNIGRTGICYGRRHSGGSRRK